MAEQSHKTDMYRMHVRRKETDISRPQWEICSEKLCFAISFDFILL